jgi:hypothetical protein
MPAEVNEILLESEAFGPFGFGPNGLEVFDAGHHGIVVLDDIIDRQHAKSKLRRLQFLRDLEICRYERLRGLWCAGHDGWLCGGNGGSESMSYLL